MAQTDTPYSEIKAQVKYFLGRSNTEIDAQMNMWARFAMRAICRWRDHWFERAEASFNTVDGTQAYDLPDDFKGDPKLYILKSNGFVEVRGPIGLPEALRRFSPAGEGEPTDWSFCQDETTGVDQIKLWPPDPNAVFVMKLEYTRYLADLEDDADVNVLTLNYPDLLIAMMTHYGYMHLQEYQDAAVWEAKAEKIMKDMHAQWVSRVIGSDFHLAPRSDVYGTSKSSRQMTSYVIIK